MLSPLPRRSHWRYCIAHSSSGISLPRYGSRVGLRIVLFEVYSAFTRVTACTLALSPYFATRFTRRLQPFRYLHSCSGCFRLEHLPGGACTHWKAPPYHGARQDQSVKLLLLSHHLRSRDRLWQQWWFFLHVLSKFASLLPSLHNCTRIERTIALNESCSPFLRKFHYIGTSP
jgi:hypothetical protein